MTSPFATDELDLAQLGAARAQHLIYEAIHDLWLKRQNEGLKQSDIADILGKHRSWVSRALAGPGNWTIETLGGLVEALDGHMEIKVVPVEDVRVGNYSFYDDIIDQKKWTHCTLTKYRPTDYTPAQVAESESSSIVLVNYSGKPKSLAASK